MIRIAKEYCVSVAGDDWYERRRQDDEGKFWRSIAAQGPRANGQTFQGTYLATADGQFLAFTFANDGKGMRAMLTEGLKKWKQLPEDSKRPGAVKVPDLDKPDPRYDRSPPEGGLVVNTYTRILERDNKGKLAKGHCKERPEADKAAHDHLWLTREEVQALVPPDAKKGASFPVSPKVADRIVRYHLIDNTRGEPPTWEREQVRSEKLTLTVEDVTAGKVRLKLEGTAVLANKEDVSAADMGFDARLLGRLEYDRAKKTFDRFDVAVLGDHWGAGPDNSGGVRSGRQPLGIFMELAGDNMPADRVPPQGARSLDFYLGRGE